MNESEPVTDKKERNRKTNKILLPIIGVIFLVLIVAVVGSSMANQKHAKFTATIDTTNFNVVNPATLSVTIHVTNTGDAAGTPTCTINVNDANSTYTGADLATLSSVEPGKTVTTVDNVTITKQGAQYVTAGKIDCH